MSKRPTDGNAPQRCDFCGRPEAETLLLMSAQEGATICNFCVEQTHALVRQELGDLPPSVAKGAAAPQVAPLLRPSEIKQHLDQYVIGQEEAKKVLSVAVYNHYKRMQNASSGHEVELEKSNVLLLGPTGTGKTLLARTIARILNVPFTIADATVLTEAGYVGEDVENILVRLLQAANYDVEATQRGIVYLDEVDKISRKSDNASLSRDVSGEGVQQSLLKIVEGTVANVPPKGGRKHPEQTYIQIDTRNILFICGGAFEGLDSIIERRLDTQSIGFSAGNNRLRLSTARHDVLQYVQPEDLRKYGLIPELIGRLPVIAAMHPLSRSAMKSILTEPRNALVKQFQRLFEMDGIQLSFADDALDFIVEEAEGLRVGARGLRSILETIMNDAMFDYPGSGQQELLITRAYCEELVARRYRRAG